VQFLSLPLEAVAPPQLMAALCPLLAAPNTRWAPLPLSRQAAL